MRFLPEMRQDIPRNFANPFRMQQCLTILRRTQLLLVLFRFKRLEPGTHVVVIDFEFQHLFVANRVRDHVGMQLAAKNAGRCFGPHGVLRENRGPRKSELIKAFELAFQVSLRLTELAAVTLIKDEHDVLAIDRQVIFALHQVIQFLDRGDDDAVVIAFQIASQPRRAVRTIHTVR